MESLVNLFGGIYGGKKVLVTGHTGFKGSWLCLWLREMGAEVLGYALSPNTDPNHFDLLKLDIESKIADIRDLEQLRQAISDFSPDIVFHLAAQPLVRLSYQEPVDTFETNIMGTVNLLEACRSCETVRAIVVVTSDKCYENREWIWGYRENEAMGGFDPYSSSKGCAELVTSAYRNSFYNLHDFGTKHQVLIATARAGNVIGGGDWALDRLIPDIMKATSEGRSVLIRNPQATRPWQHVLEPLSGYLLLGQKLLEGQKLFAEGWNFGPEDSENKSVETVIRLLQQYWQDIHYSIEEAKEQPHEAYLLKLDCSKAHACLGWFGVDDAQTTFSETVFWYKEYYSQRNVISRDQLISYIKTASTKGAVWI